MHSSLSHSKEKPKKCASKSNISTPRYFLDEKELVDLPGFLILLGVEPLFSGFAFTFEREAKLLNLSIIAQYSNQDWVI